MKSIEKDLDAVCEGFLARHRTLLDAPVNASRQNEIDAFVSDVVEVVEALPYGPETSLLHSLFRYWISEATPGVLSSTKAMAAEAVH